MSKSNVYEAGLLDLIFLNVDFENVGDAGGLQGSAIAGSLYVSLHTSDPGEAGSQTTNEAAYTSYDRVAVARSGAEWTRTDNEVVNDNAITFPEATGGSETVTHFGIGTTASGTGILLYKGELTSSLAVSSGIAPEFAAGALSVTED